MGRLVKCAYCDGQVDKDIAERYNDKNYHADCCKKQKDRDELISYICNLFGLKKPGPVVYSQLKRFVEVQKYTYEGILHSLQYFYDVKKGSKQKANQAIGIVPYVYDEAQDYYTKLSYKQDKVAEVVSKQMEKTPVVIRVKKQEIKEKPQYNLEDF